MSVAPTVIDVYADVVCPFAHVGLTRFVSRRDRSSADMVLRVRSWPLEVVNGQPLRAENVAPKIDALRRTVSPDLFTGFQPAHWPGTSLPALELVAHVNERDVRAGERLSILLRAALFEHGQDISDAEVLAALAAEVGAELPGGEARRLVEADRRRGQALGVKGSPHFFVDHADFFCPALQIAHVGDDLAIADDVARFDRFFQRCTALAA